MRIRRRAPGTIYWYGRRPRAASRTSKLIALGAALALVGGTALAATAGAAGKDHKVTLCHATDSYTNPYVQITVDYHSVIQGGHGGHDGPIFDPVQPPKWGDIIPPFDFGPDAQYAGMNWTPDGQATLANGCSPSIATTTTTGGA